MPELTPTSPCVICGSAGEPQNPLVPDGLDDEVAMCLRCLNSPSGKAWREAKRAADPLYDRYHTLITVSLPAECPQCGLPLYVSAKARGMASACWDVPCLNCHRWRPKPMYGFGDTEAAFNALQSIEHDFVRSRGLDQIEHRVAEVARAYDHLINAEPCPCGGRFSLAAKPRCPRCNTVAFDSFFHDVHVRTETR